MASAVCCTCEELQEVVEHVGDSQHHFWKQPGGRHFCGGVLQRLHSNRRACEVMLDHAACRTAYSAASQASSMRGYVW